jgi:hypothetical protein
MVLQNESCVMRKLLAKFFLQEWSLRNDPLFKLAVALEELLSGVCLKYPPTMISVEALFSILASCAFVLLMFALARTV